MSRFYILFLFLLLILFGCASKPEKPSKKLYWPPPPAQPRIVYEATLRDSNSVKLPTREDQLKSIATNLPNIAEQKLVKPYDIAAKEGLILVSDTTLSVVHAFDLPRKKLFAIGWRGQVKLQKPLGVAFDNTKNIYVADAGLKRVVKFDQQGHYLKTIGEPKDFSRIIDVSVSPINQNIYVLDRGGVETTNHHFKIFDAEGRYLKTIGTRGHDIGQFNHPVQISVADDGKVYVLDSGNFRVQIFSAEGDYLNSWGRLGKKMGDLARARGLAVSQQNYVFVSDSAFQNFQIFNAQGQLLLNIGQGGGEDLPAQYLLPAGIAVDETDRIYVVDQLRRKVDVFRLLTDAEINQLQ